MRIQRERKAKRAAAANVLTFDRLPERYIEEHAKPRKSNWRNAPLTSGLPSIRAANAYGKPEVGFGGTRRCGGLG